MSTSFDDFLRSKEASRAGVSAEAATDIGPDEAARRAKYRRVYGFDPPEPAAQSAMEARRETEEAVRRQPKLSNWLEASMSNVALARGAMANMADVADTIVQTKQPKGFMARAGDFFWQTLGREDEQGNNYIRDDLTAANTGRALGAGTLDVGTSIAGLGQMLADTNYRAGSPLLATQALFDLGLETTTGRTARQLLGRARKETDRFAAEVAPDAKTDAGGSILQGIRSLPVAATALLGGAYAQSAKIAATLVGGLSAGQSYGEGLDASLTPDRAARYAAINGLIEAGTEFLPFAQLLPGAGGNFASRFVQSLAADIPGEQLATFGQDLNQFLTIDQPEGKTWQEFADERGTAAFDTLVASVVGSGSLATASEAAQFAARKLGRRTAELAAVEDNGRFFDTLNRLAAANGVLSRDPQSFEDFVDQAADGTDATDVFIEAAELQNVLNQSDLTVEQVFEITGLTPEGLQQAADRGEDISMPVGQYAARIATSALSEQLLPHLRLAPDQMSRAQAEMFLQGAQEEFQADAEAMLTEGTAGQERAASRQRVEETMLAQLNSTRRFTNDVNQTYASIVGAFFETQSAKIGLTAEELAGRYGLTVQSGEVARPTYGQSPLVNIGLDIPEAAGGGTLDPQTVRDALSAMGITISQEAVQQSDTEATLVAELDRALTAEEAAALGEQLQQEAIAQFADGQGGLYGPQAANWGDFNPAFFLGMDGRRLAETMDQGLPEFIEIDGVQRPTTNSTGQPIAQSEEGVRNFWAWFGDSKVVDAEGRPLVVYHGTGADFTAFSGLSWASVGAELANEYAAMREATGRGVGRVLPLYVSARRIFDADNGLSKSETVGSFFNAALEQAIEQGAEIDIPRARELLDKIRTAAAREGSGPRYDRFEFWHEPVLFFGKDGAEAINEMFGLLGFDAITMRENGSATFGAFRPEQIKSVDNVGTFDPSTPAIYNHGPLPIINPLDAFKRESYYPTRAVRYEDGTVYADIPDWYPDRQAKLAEQLGAKAVEAVDAGDPRLDQGVPLWHTRPPVTPDGMIRLDHWGSKDITQTDPSRWGESGTLPPSERSAITSSLPRTFFGIASGQPGGYIIEFPQRVQYEAMVPADRLYDVTADPDGLKPAKNVNELERKIKAAGYLGYWNSDQQLGLVATVFEPVDVQPAGAQTMFQDAVFFSALERTLEQTATQKASAQQWEATLRKTPGIKAEELEWTGILDFLQMQEGPITRDQLLEIVRGAGIRVDEVLLGERLFVDSVDELMGGRVENPTQFSSWVSDTNNETYRELLITLPIGEGRNPNRAPSTHWDTDGVIAHARFMDKTDADGKRVLFIEEVQSDWHQKGRDQGYAQTLTQVEKASAQEAYGRANDRLTAAILAVRTDMEGVELTGEYAGIPAPRLANFAAQAGVSVERVAELEAARLAVVETSQAVNSQTAGIPNAPFRTDWPALVMKRMIRWGAEHGYERIAWTTGEQQAARYNLSGAVGRLTHDGRDSDGYRVRMGLNASYALEERGFGQIVEQDNVRFENTLRMTEVQMREAFGNDVTQKIIEGEQGDVFDGDDLRVGGEGMKAFYDRNLVNITNKLVKKFGAKVGVVQTERTLLTADEAFLAGRDGAVTETSDQWGFDITPELADAAMGGFPLFQRDRGPRGQIAFSPDITQDPSVITLLRGADLSTFMHELGHFFFEVTNHMANQAGAPAELIADRDAMLRYLGVESATEWENRTPDQRREGHERIARSFEAYLFEGKTPAVELQGVFAKLRSWMMQVYRTITRLNVQLTDEVRGVFDRMLASEEQIAEAQADAEMRPLFADKPEGMSDADWAEYQTLNGDATTEAAKALESRSLRDMRYASNATAREIKRLQREVADQRAAMREEVEAELAQMPVYRAITLFRTGMLDGTQYDGEVKLNTEVIREALQLEGAPLPDAFRGMTKTGGLHPQQAAELFGYSSADHLLKDLLFAAPFSEAVDAETDVRMRERYGEVNTPAEVEEAARAAVHNEVRGRFVATELAALQNAPGKKRVLAAAARRIAEGTIARLRIRDIRPGQYEAAERRAAREATKAGASNLDEAVRQKRNQLLQFNLARAAHEARDEVKAARDYLTKFDTKKTRANIDPDFMDQIDQLLEAVELRQVSNRESDRRKALSKWVEEMQGQGFEPAFDVEALARKPWRELTVEEMRGLRDAVRNIEHLGRLTKKLLTARDKADLDTAANEMAEAVRANATRDIDPIVGAKTWWELVRGGVTDFFAMHRKMANMAYIFDGNKYGGVFWDRFIRPMNAAGDRETTMTREANLRLAALFQPILQENTTKREYIPEIGKSLSLEDRLMVALNMGNEANLQRLMDGDRWTYEQVQAVVRPLTGAQWDFVQNVWTEIDSWWPQIAAKETRVAGIAPEKVEPLPFQVEIDGELRMIPGGYFPIKYDPDRSSKADADEAAEVLRQMTRGLYTNASTRRGHTKERVDSVVGRPLRKDFGVIFGHVNQVIHDLAWHEYLIDANRLLKHGAVDSAIRDHHGPEALRWMRKALEDIAVGDLSAQNAFEKSIRHLRTGVSISAMGWSVWTSLLQPTGLTQSMSRIGTRHVMKGLGDLFSSPSKMNEKVAWIYEVSPFMRDRGNTMQREINEIRNHIGPKSPLRKVAARVVPEQVSGLVADSYFYMIGKAQLIADLPTWLGQYQKSIDEGTDPDTAVAIADQAVIDSQGSGQIKDLAGIQRGSELMKLFTNFYSYFSATFNLMSDRTEQLRRIGAKDLPYYAVDMLLLTTVPSVMATLMYQLLRAGEDDEEEILKAAAVDNVAYLMGLMVGVREIGGTLAGIAGYQGPAGARFFAEVAGLGKQLSQGEADEALARAGNRTAGILLHYPATQIDRTVRGGMAVAEGEAPPQAVIMGPPPNQ